jgi:hypothetical protein
MSDSDKSITECIPDICANDILADKEFCDATKDLPITLNQLYTGGYTIINSTPTITTGIKELYEDTVGPWLGKFALAIMIPYVIVFIVLFIVLIRNNVISVYTGAILIILSIVLALIAIIFIISDTTKAGTYLKTSTKELLTNNWDKNKEKIFYDLGMAYISPDSLTCPPISSTNVNVATNMNAASNRHASSNVNASTEMNTSTNVNASSKLDQDFVTYATSNIDNTSEKTHVSDNGGDSLITNKSVLTSSIGYFSNDDTVTYVDHNSVLRF